MEKSAKNSFLNKKLPTKAFVLTQIFLTIFGLAFIFFVHYKMNIEYQPQRSQFLGRGPITTAPATLNLQISSPADDLLTFQSSQIISGTTSPNISVLITSSTQNIVVESKIDGSFSTVVNLTEGLNLIKIVAFSATGDQKELVKTIYYSKEKI